MAADADDHAGRSPASDAVIGGLGPGSDPTRGADVPPPPDQPQALAAWQLVGAARACQVMGSPLYAHLLTTAAQDLLADGPVADLLVPRVRPGRGDAAALRFMAAVHHLVLTGRAPQLAAHFPTAGGTPVLATVGDALLTTVADHLELLAVGVERPCQTNEVGRAAGLIVGLLDIAARTGLPMALREIGAAAGLNLRLDAWRYELPGGTVVGDPAGEVVLAGRWRDPIPHDDARLEVVDRRGCDQAPIDPTSADGHRRLSASVWGDQPQRLERLEAAIRTAVRVPVVVDHADASAWIERHLIPTPGRVTVLYHSIVEEYLSAAERRAVHERIRAAGRTARADAPIAWLRMEPSTQLRHHTVSVRLWPYAPEERILATTGAHGDDVRIVPETTSPLTPADDA